MYSLTSVILYSKHIKQTVNVQNIFSGHICVIKIIGYFILDKEERNFLVFDRKYVFADNLFFSAHVRFKKKIEITIPAVSNKFLRVSFYHLKTT